MYSHRLLADVCGLDKVEDGVVRVSFLHYNTGEWIYLDWICSILTRTEAEVRGLVEVLQEVLGSL